MASKKDMRRSDLIVPYQDLEKEKDTPDMANTMSSTLPMVAIFTRNKLLGWTAVMFSIQQWLSETSAQKAKAASPAYFSIAMALLSVMVGYMPLFMPPQPGRGTASGTEAPAAVPS